MNKISLSFPAGRWGQTHLLSNTGTQWKRRVPNCLGTTQLSRYPPMPQLSLNFSHPKIVLKTCSVDNAFEKTFAQKSKMRGFQTSLQRRQTTKLASHPPACLGLVHYRHLSVSRLANLLPLCCGRPGTSVAVSNSDRSHGLRLCPTTLRSAKAYRQYSNGLRHSANSSGFTRVTCIRADIGPSLPTPTQWRPCHRGRRRPTSSAREPGARTAKPDDERFVPAAKLWPVLSPDARSPPIVRRDAPRVLCLRPPRDPVQRL